MAGIGLRCSGWGGGCRYGGGRGNGQCKASSLGGGKNSTINAEFSGHRPTLSNIIAALAKAGSNTSPINNGECVGDGGGGGGGSGGEKNRHTLRFYRVAPTLAVECSTLYTASASSASAHPSNDRKDDDKSGRRGGTHHRCSNCNNVAGYPRRHMSRDHD